MLRSVLLNIEECPKGLLVAYTIDYGFDEICTF